MKRRDLLGAIGGSFALSMATPYLGATAQERSPTRTVHETAAERLRQVYSYIPNTPEYEALALGNARWSDISKQLDAFGYAHQREYFREQAWRGAVWFTSGNAFRPPSTEPDPEVQIAVLDADQVVQLGGPTTFNLFVGIDAAQSASVFQQKGYVATSFTGGTLYVHADVDIRQNISWNRFAVLLDDGVLAWLDTEESAQRYVSWLEEGGSMLADSEAVISQLELVESDSITLSWLEGSVFDVRTVGGATQIDAHSLIAEEERLFGKMPRILSVSVGIDAGAIMPNLRNPEELPPEMVVGYNHPNVYAELTFLSGDDAYLAADIIEWRLEYAPSALNGKTADINSTIDRSDAVNSILIHRFDQPFGATVIHNMRDFSDPFLYGWGH